ncbi:uncharacterized protein P174DRAFT_464477 [Aspergillus novofumigatus IBT 16806]|uniref:Aminoglycoside phosphotransferase domain-containing protein n=1 Tax=Aspergillus novofumigatus (strain IBT 16806) TaxID=1392255 RepID=A0A2I1BVF6_ASPN1|nr:uncharacterized protein P174DRAFT_464477 [Aspergillus novofumigatus IBT 16806]PKX89346.1 hypothetical protein P174DRAFT_464477 [Aspergillus novofumigatus IBT 16806]
MASSLRTFLAAVAEKRQLSNVGSKSSALSPHPLPDRDSEEPVPRYGRWLPRDELERKSRPIVFDFTALCDRAIRLCPGAKEIIKWEEREAVVARLPTGNAGPPRLTTSSEVATMTYLDDPSKPIGTEYITQEHVAGVQLHQTWPKMNPQQHMLCTKMLSLAMRDMASLDFPAYGSLYFSDAPLESHMKIPFEEGFCIGPNCSPVFWNRNPGEHELYGGTSPNCGRDLAGYYLGLIETGFSPLPKEDAGNRDLLLHQGSIQDHFNFLEISKEVMQKVIKGKRIQDAATPALLHPDFHKSNILCLSRGSNRYYWSTPDFAALPLELEGTTLQNGQEECKDPGQKQREEKDAWICYQTYDFCMKGPAPKLRPARSVDPILFRVFQYCHTTWRENFEGFETHSDGWVPNNVWGAAKDAHRAAYDEWIRTTRESESRGNGLTVAKAHNLWPLDAR